MKTIANILILLVVPVLAVAMVPSDIQSALKKLYPKVSDPDWTMDNHYYVAGFTSDGFEKSVWLDANGNWIMTQTDLQTMDEVPAAVYNTFALGTYSNAPVKNVLLAELPKCPSVIVVEVGEYNMDACFYLFYSLQGELINTYNCDYFDGAPGPQIFECP